MDVKKKNNYQYLINECYKLPFIENIIAFVDQNVGYRIEKPVKRRAGNEAFVMDVVYSYLGQRLFFETSSQSFANKFCGFLRSGVIRYVIHDLLIPPF